MDFRSPKAAALIVLFTIFLFTCVSSHKAPCPPPSSSGANCPIDTLKFGICGSWLGLVSEVIGTKPSPECCTLIKGLADLEVAVCLCTALKANVLGVVHLEVHVALSLLLNACGTKAPEGFKC